MIKIEGWKLYGSNDLLPVQFKYDCSVNDLMYNVVYFEITINDDVHQIILN